MKRSIKTQETESETAPSNRDVTGGWGGGGDASRGTYRPLEVDGHPDGGALGDGVGVGTEGVGERGAVRARGLRVDDVLRVFETHAEKYLTLERRGAREGVDLQLEHAGGEGLGGQRGGTLSAGENGKPLQTYVCTHAKVSETCVKSTWTTARALRKSARLQRTAGSACSRRQESERGHSPCAWTRAAAGDTKAAAVSCRRGGS